VQLWWGKRKKSLLKEYQQLQNSALRQILGAFRGSPIRAMEIEAALPPVSLRAEKLCNQYAIRVLSLAKNHPIRTAIQKQQQKQISTQLGELAKRAQGHSNVEEISILLAKPWSKPASAYATLTISTSSKDEAAKLHTQWLQGLENREKEPILLYTDGSKKGEEVAAGYCQVSLQGGYTQAKNISLGKKQEIMDAELAAIRQALQNLESQDVHRKEIHVFADSQAALKRLRTITLTGGQRVCYEITELCKTLLLRNNKICISWVPGHREIQGNEHADKLAKAGLKRKAINPITSLSYLKRKAKEGILASWKQEWKNIRKAEKGKAYTTATQDRPKISYKMQILARSKRTQAAYFQLKLGKGFFKQFSKAIGKDDKGECFGNCRSLQTPKHLLLHCKHYTMERRKMTEALNTPTLTLQQLFTTAKGSAALLAFLEKTNIATASWLLAAGAL
jgi:ribonuclease HI